MIFQFPVPPSLNNIYATYNGHRVPSRKFKAWKKDAGPKVLEQWEAQGSLVPSKGYSLHYRVNISYAGDIGNREKAATDLLVSVIPGFPDDKWCDEITIRRDTTIDGCIVEVRS